VRKHVKDDLLTYPKQPEWERQGWHAARSYRIEDGILWEERNSFARGYKPLKEFELPSALARITAEDPSERLDLVSFASEFGLLGYNHLVPPEERKREFGDPIHWIHAHSATVRFCIKFIGLLEEGDDAATEDEFKHEKRWIGAERHEFIDWCIESDQRDLKTEPHLRNTTSAIHVLRQRLSFIITGNIAGVTRSLLLSRSGTVSSLLTFRAMIEAVYWQLANRLEGGGVRRCLSCGGFFLSRDKRQQYCPPHPGSTRSRCSSVLNTRNFRARKKD
jgi:hypothetical protein